MTRLPLAPLVAMVLALALPPTLARAQSAGLLDDTQRAAIQDYFRTQAEKAAAAEQAKQAKEAEKAKKPAAKAPAKKPAKKVEKPKKPAKPKKPTKPKTTEKAKAKPKAATKSKAAATAQPPAPAARAPLEPGQLLAQDLPRRALPKDLDSKLGKPARGTQRVIVGNDVVLFEPKTGRILDVMDNAVIGGGAGR